jgi:hypothetical protein
MTSIPPQAPKKKNSNLVWILAIVGIAGCGCIGVLGAILFPVFSQAKLAAHKTAFVSDGKQLALATLIYASDNEDALPLAPGWHDALRIYMRDEDTAILEPGNVNDTDFTFGYFEPIAGWDTFSFEFPDLTPIYFTSSTLGPSPVSNPEDFAYPFHEDGIVVNVDGSVDVINYDESEYYDWAPEPLTFGSGDD